MKDYKKDFKDKLKDGSFCDGELISIANGYITEMQDIITELEAEKDKAWWEGFDTCKAKAGEANVKLSEELETERKKNADLEAQIEKMKWHKIADGDIPKVTGDYITNIGVLTYDHYGNNIYKWHTPFCEACDYGDEVDEDEVIAWCEIPKYTKEIKEK